MKSDEIDCVVLEMKNQRCVIFGMLLLIKNSMVEEYSVWNFYGWMIRMGGFVEFFQKKIEDFILVLCYFLVIFEICKNK